MPDKNEPTLLKIVMPVADYQDAARGVADHARRHGVAGKRAVLLPSEKSSSPPFIQVLVGRMNAETESARVWMENVDWPFFHPARREEIGPDIDRVARDCDLMISGVAY
ncbi:MAG TPA: hypothetical protein VED01_11965 [Burkholderiales bacterium]|nr:hypothetical protein [Burkholderiales bacterium]